MTNGHLTEAEMQQYALDSNSCTETIVTHINHCAYCQQEAMIYKLMFHRIEAQEKAVFDFDLTELVMARLPQEQTTHDKSFLYIITTAIIIMSGVVSYEFGNNIVDILSSLTPMLVSLVILASFGVMIFFGVDMYQRYKAQMKVLDFY
ncbi:hypothetical protein [Emticicia sp. BO119]|uniref:hypothetical protein n=1 Tax=Emticicia sp. BO119 TaxID=2757768 RepID=UPI0015F094C6|nr:hypothetical protein [Emticicia sp. BO119]MBA4849293.1 hypothetical protein [Emticicia sp. BO119]